jgi:serine protease Do
MSQFDPRPVGRRFRTGLAAVLLAGTALGGFAAGHYALAAAVDPSAAIAPVAPARTLPDFADLVEHVKPAVVSITTKLRSQPASDEEIPTPFGMLRPDRPHAVEARGSGFIIDADGTVVTNNHVVNNGESVSVTLADGTELPAKVIGRDARTDLAVLKIDAGHALPYVNLGDSAKVRPGEWVVAMGNPFGLGGTVTAGIVSASGRDIGSGPYDNFIQIDAPINQGNSGGPLFTQDGHVVGVNSAIISPSGGSVGIGFAIPSDMVRTVVAELKTDGHVTRGYLGVGTQPVTPAMATALHLPGTDKGGALVAQVEPDGPAAKAGLQPGDVIRAVDGKSVADPRDLAIDVADIHPGSAAKLDLLRDGKTQTVSVTIASMKNDAVTSRDGVAGQDQQGVGVALAPLTPELRGELDLPAHTRGAVVANVKPDSPAAEAGIRQGDVIVGVGSATVASPSDAASAIRSAVHKDHAVALRILRDGQTAFVAIDMSKAPASSDQG